MTTAARQLDTSELKQRVQSMYEEVALEPGREFHFETGRLLAERLGYPPAELDRIPAAAIDSFAGSERIMFAASRFEPSIPFILGAARRE